MGKYGYSYYNKRWNNYNRNYNSIQRRNYYNSYREYSFHDTYTRRQGNRLIKTVNHGYLRTDRRNNFGNRYLTQGQELCLYNNRQPDLLYQYDYENNYSNYNYRYKYDYQFYDRNNYCYRYKYQQIKRLY